MPALARDHKHGNEAIPADLTLTSLTVGTVTADTVTVDAGTGTGTVKPGGTLSVQTGSVGTDAGTAEKVLFTYTLPANTLAVNGQRLTVSALFVPAATADNKTMRLRFGGIGGTIIAAAGADAFNGAGDTVLLSATIIRTGATTQDAWGLDAPGTAAQAVFAQFAQPTQTLSGTVAIVATGQNAAATANDILGKGLIVEWWPVP